LKIKTIENNLLSLRFNNGSQVKAIGTSPDAGRSEALSLLILDEAAFLPYVDEI
jgi:phage FluMu gp28-like protein